MRIKITTIIGYDAPRSEMPALELNEGMDRAVWIENHMKSTHRSGHWNMVSAEKIAAKMGIVDGLKIKHIN
jgi:hypothetical protein